MKGSPKTYTSPTAFRRALEDRLKRIRESESLDFQRLLREVAFDRLLARLFAAKDAPWVLKGGYAMELRIKEARVTRDIDLALRHALGAEKGRPINSVIQQALQDAAGRDLGDHFSFVIGAAMQDLDGAPYGGARFPVESILDARTFVKFHIDVGAGDAVMAPLETLSGRDWLAFAGVAAPKMPAISPRAAFLRETACLHFASHQAQHPRPRSHRHGAADKFRQPA